MQKLLRKGSLSLYQQGKMDKEAMHNYFMSVTEREVINGILNVSCELFLTLQVFKYTQVMTYRKYRFGSK